MKPPNRCFAALRSCASVKESPKISSVGSITRSPLKSSAAKKFVGHNEPSLSEAIQAADLVEAVAAGVVVLVVAVHHHLHQVREVVLQVVVLAVVALAGVVLVADALVADVLVAALDRVVVLVALVAAVPEVVADSSR